MSYRKNVLVHFDSQELGLAAQYANDDLSNYMGGRGQNVLRLQRTRCSVLTHPVTNPKAEKGGHLLAYEAFEKKKLFLHLDGPTLGLVVQYTMKYFRTWDDRDKSCRDTTYKVLTLAWLSTRLASLEARVVRSWLLLSTSPSILSRNSNHNICQLTFSDY
jgi:hypothetical protein